MLLDFHNGEEHSLGSVCVTTKGNVSLFVRMVNDIIIILLDLISQLSIVLFGVVAKVVFILGG